MDSVSDKSMPADYTLDQARACDWKADFSHENGNYWCHCIECDRQFVGHKRRVLCFLCASPPPALATTAPKLTYDKETRSIKSRRIFYRRRDDKAAAEALDTLSRRPVIPEGAPPSATRTPREFATEVLSAYMEHLEQHPSDSLGARIAAVLDSYGSADGGGDANR